MCIRDSTHTRKHTRTHTHTHTSATRTKNSDQCGLHMVHSRAPTLLRGSAMEVSGDQGGRGGGRGQGGLASGEDVRDAARTVSDIASYGGT